MGDVGDFFFGETKDAKQTGTAPTMTAAQQELLEKINSIMQEQLGQGVPGYSGPTASGPTSIQNNIFKMMEQLTSGRYSPQQNPQAAQALQMILSGTDPSTVQQQQVQGYDVGEFDPTAVQNWYQNSMVDPAMRQWEERIAPAVQEKFISQNAGSSGAANRAISRSASDMMTDLNAQLANTLFGEKQAHDTRQFTAGLDTSNKQFQSGADYLNRLFQGGQSDLDRATAVPGAAMQTSQQPFDQLMQILNQGTVAGATQYDIQNMLAQGDFQSWLSQQAYNNPWLNLIAPALGAKAFEPIVQGPTQQSGLMEFIMPAVGSYLGSK